MKSWLPAARAIAVAASVTDEAAVATMIGGVMSHLGPRRYSHQQRRHSARQDLREDEPRGLPPGASTFI